uniref:UDP-GlcNAc:betaGal beta-1,3-N-acetylglucosaminyltransferase like 1 n=1 Tax=Oryzias latipes TaxID=8090 RepID=A0A3P9H856_ORYLA
MPSAGWTSVCRAFTSRTSVDPWSCPCLTTPALTTPWQFWRPGGTGWRRGEWAWWFQVTNQHGPWEWDTQRTKLWLRALVNFCASKMRLVLHFFTACQIFIHSAQLLLTFLQVTIWFLQDDIMLPQRVRLQLESSLLHPNSLIGSRISRLPQGSTERYTRWINSLTPDQLQTQAFTSHGPTVVMPTWFCSRKLFQKVGPFNEGGKGVPEDLLFFYQHLRQGGSLVRVNECLLVYRYHEEAATHSVTEETMWKLRLDFLQERVLSQWEHFTIWSAGKQGRKLFRSLSPSTQKKVRAFCDVDVKKIKRGFYTYEESQERPKPRVPVLDFREACGPFIICVKLDMTGGELEENLSSLHLKEGIDYYHFS